MYRKELIKALLNNPMSVHELAMAMEAPIKEVRDDLQHLHKSLRHSPYQIAITPAKCNQCGFVFHRSKMSKPSRCPQCKGTWINAPLIQVKEKH